MSFCHWKSSFSRIPGFCHSLLFLMFTERGSVWIRTTAAGPKVTSCHHPVKLNYFLCSPTDYCLSAPQPLSISRTLWPPSYLSSTGGLSLLSHPSPHEVLSHQCYPFPKGIHLSHSSTKGSCLSHSSPTRGLGEVQGRWRWTFPPAEALLLRQTAVEHQEVPVVLTSEDTRSPLRTGERVNIAGTTITTATVVRVKKM